MKLKYVTLTGADNSVQPEKLADLSEKYPFVEWAILFSQSKAGVSRYPDWDWVESLLEVADARPMNLSAHLCGKWVDDAMKGEITFLRDSALRKAFQRVQLNMGKDRLRLAVNCEPLHEAVRKAHKPVIFGGNYQHVTVDARFFRQTGLYPLFDASGGRGVLTRVWPPVISDEQGPLFCGYAGGLGPENISEELPLIAEAAGEAEAWVDMETKIRSGEKFDLTKCEHVLQAAQAWAG